MLNKIWMPFWKISSRKSVRRTNCPWSQPGRNLDGLIRWRWENPKQRCLIHSQNHRYMISGRLIGIGVRWLVLINGQRRRWSGMRDSIAKERTNSQVANTKWKTSSSAINSTTISNHYHCPNNHSCCPWTKGLVVGHVVWCLPLHQGASFPSPFLLEIEIYKK